MGGFLKESKTRFLSSNPNELCDRLILLLQAKQAGAIFNLITEANVAIADKRLEYHCVSTHGHRFLIIDFQISDILCPIDV